MTSLKHVLRSAFLAAALVAGFSFQLTRAADPSVDDLKTKAFAALKEGKFDVTNDLLTRASALDPKLKMLSDWTAGFEAQLKVFSDQRHKEYDKAVGEVKLLLDKHKDSFAIDAASRAYILADDKDAFRKQAWVDDLIKKTAQLGEQFEANEDWLKAMRVYSDLSQVEPPVAEWKDRLKIVTRRVRLLATFTPDAFKAIQESESKERQEVDALLHPTTLPTATTKPDADEAGFKTDWNDSLKDIQMDMLRQGLADANDNYYRDVSYKQMTLGGLKALRVVLTTKGLEKAFPGMADAAKVKASLDYLNSTIDAMAASKVEDGADMLKKIIGDPQGKEASDRLGTLRMALNVNGVSLPERVIVSEFADGAFAELDPFTNMIWPAEVEEFNKQTQGKFTGVGIQIQSDEDGSLKVVSPLEDSPAFKAGIKAGDIVTHINGKSAKGISLNQAVRQITGPAGSQVTLTIRGSDGGAPQDKTLTRQEINVTSIKGWMRDNDHGGWDYYIDPQQKIGYIRLTNFTATTAVDMNHALDVLKAGQADGVKGIILDLRYDPGGLLNAATEVCDRFIDKGVIVSTKPDRETPNQPTEVRAIPEHDKVTVPMIVLVNQYSASASEIVSGALKDQHRALIVGERSFGKGSVQMLFPLAQRTAMLKLTTSHYYLPSGRCLHRDENSTVWGVDPDVKVEVTPEQMRAAIDARQDADILHNKGEPGDKNKKAVDPLGADAQLSAALLLMRLELNGAPSLTATAAITH